MFFFIIKNAKVIPYQKVYWLKVFLRVFDSKKNITKENEDMREAKRKYRITAEIEGVDIRPTSDLGRDTYHAEQPKHGLHRFQQQFVK